MLKRLSLFVVCFAVFLTACQFPTSKSTPTPVSTAVPIPTSFAPSESALVPNFTHIAVIVFENQNFDSVIGVKEMPVLNGLAKRNTLLSQFYAATHPSLPNYIALISGDTQNITTNCKDCFVNALTLPDYIEASGRTWKTYQDDMPSPCYLGDSGRYAQKHNPFVYFDPIRLDATRCKMNVVPLTTLDADVELDALPNFLFITPNLCNDSHDCNVDVSDKWLDELFAKLVPAFDSTGEPYLIVLMFDEGDNSQSCCGLPDEAGGHVAVVLISPQAKQGFVDRTAYSHYSILKTIAEAWGLPYLGHAADDATPLIVAPWK